ncbi:ABC transporter permease [Spongiibacter taiwanensis]|uniref:ABC transporter permease n=1 Tax=Spongiibacter taiwanensis TaxID=1748242 RepID=UPI002035CE34|nr:ABC transporter permease [Spongiibacter taiwanensis]USA43219.1 ABC transporter permease [Spongiibacter taiwanensis]
MFKQNTMRYLSLAGFSWMIPVFKLATGENPREQGQEILRQIGLPVLAVLIFLAIWSTLAARVDTSLGTFPGPAAVYSAAQGLVAEHKAEREKADAFYQRQVERNEKKLAKNPDAEVKIREYTGKATFIDQIFTSLKTVFTGFVVASLIAIPIGVACGLSPLLNAAIAPLIQIFKPVSPLAWLPLVTMVVSAVYVSDDPLFAKSFVNSAITVTLCCMWPTLINTAVGVASIDKDLINVGRVIRLGWVTRVRKIAIPASLPMIFTGLRISLGIGWMVLIAAEMLAQNPGLGKFVWDEFQNGSSESLARIMVAVITIGFIGFLLDSLMQTLHKVIARGEANS